MPDDNTKPDLSREQAIELLRSDLTRWNQLREQYSTWTPDLRWASLEGCSLVGANLERATLFYAKLAGADLSAANLDWAQLRSAHLSRATLSKASLFQADLGEAFVDQANLRKVDMREAYLWGANLSESDLSDGTLTSSRFIDAKLNRAQLARANLRGANMTGAQLTDAQLNEAQLNEANLNNAALRGSVLRGADLTLASMVNVNLEGADLTGCRVYGVSVWDAKVDNATMQQNLVISRREDQLITVDNLEVAQFIYLLLNNKKLRSVIDTITSKVVLILGRFTANRKVVLDAIRDELRKRDYVPIVFDFEKPASQDLTGTISTLANMARFIIADLTEPSSVPHELATVVPGTVVPVQAIILKGQREFAMFRDLMRRHHWVLEPHQYKSKKLLIAHLGEWVIAPAEAKAKELIQK